jgi:hypothetical protein
MRVSAKSILGVFVGSMAVLLACLFAACGGSDESSHAGDADRRISDRELQILLDSANDFTREIIEDGLVTAEEYERAVFRTVQCMDEAGVEHTEPEFKEYRFESRWEYSIVGGIGSAADNAYIECRDAYQSAVSAIWAVQNEPTEAEKQMATEEHLACAREAGIDVETIEELQVLTASGGLTEAQRGENARCVILAFQGVDLNDLE